MKVAVVGAGKMGLPICCQFALKGAEVFACDVNQQAVDAINAGTCSIDEPGVPELLAEMVQAGRLTATTDTVEAVRQSDAVVIIVPAILKEGNHANLGILEAVTRQVKDALHPGLLICYETTLPVGTTRTVFMPMLEREDLTCGEDYFVVFSPERVKSGMVMERLETTPKVVGGANAASTERGAELYGTWLGAPITRVESLEAAEFVKLAGMLYRDVNIALANEVARYAEQVGVDFPAIQDAINSNGEAALLLPGIGVGGHCCPVYPYFMIHDAQDRGMRLHLAEQARVINDDQARHMVERLAGALGPLSGMQVCTMGLGFRPGVKEHICSSAFLIKDALDAAGAQTTLVDPMYSDDEIRSHGFEPGNLVGAHAPDAVVLNTGHDNYVNLDFPDLIQRGLKGVVDGRNFWRPEDMAKLDVAYLSVGRP
ncbi:MAG: nucleotide sugar dehydrogenase [Kiritimatiellia bacterium]|jgi:nucleotide sugar dehydrogenase